MSAVHLWIPGLARRHLDAWRLPILRDDPPDRIADLACTFPFSLETVETTLLTGVEPAHHGRCFDDEISARPRVSDLHEQLEHRREGRLAQALRADGIGAAAESAAIDAIATILTDLRRDGTSLVVSGGPAFGATPRRAALPPKAPDLRCPGGSMARLARQPTDEERVRLLEVAGVERLLDEDGLRSWHGPSGHPVLVLEPGWSFDGSAASWGRRDLDGEADAAVILAWGPGAAAWPRTVHDLRVAPTLAATVGASLAHAADDALSW